MLFFVSAAFAAAVCASPLELQQREPKTTQTTPTPTPTPAIFCSLVDKLVTAGGYQSVATKFCSSYLSIPAGSTVTTVTQTIGGVTTTTVTALTTTVQGPATTTTTTITTTKTETSTETSTTTTTDSETTTTTVVGLCSAPPTASAKVKRTTSIAKPPCFSSYSSGAALCSACSCLSIRPATFTATSTTHTTTLATTTVTVTPTETSTPTSTVTITMSTDITTTTTITNTVGTTTTSTSTVTGDPTSYPTPFKLFSTASNEYAVLINNGQVFYTERSSSGGTGFTLTGTALTARYGGQTETATGNPNQNVTVVSFLTATAMAANPTNVALTCSFEVSGGYCLLNCQVDPTLDIQLFDGFWYIGDYVPSGYTQFTPIIVDPSTLSV